MAYGLINWKDFPNEETPLSSFNLNHMDTQIKKNADAVDVLKPFKEDTEKKLAKLEQQVIKTTNGTDFKLTTSEGGVLIKSMIGASSQDGTPTPDNPIEIKSADVNIKSNNDNLCSYPYYNKTSTINNIKWIVNDDGTVSANGDTASNNSVFNFANYSAKIKLDHNKDYMVIGCPSNGTSTTYRLDVYYGKGSSAIALIGYDYGNGLKITKDMIKTFESAGYDGIRICAEIRPNATASNIIFKPMLVEVAEDGTYRTDYIRNYTTTADTSITLRAVGDIKDELIFENDKFKIIRKIGSTVLTSALSIIAQTAWDTTDTKGYRFVINGYNMTNISNYTDIASISTHHKMYKLKEETWIPTSNELVGIMQTGTQTNNQINYYCKMPSSIANVNDMKTWIDANPIEVIYPLGVYEVEEISNEDAIKLLGLKSWDDLTYLVQNNEGNGAITLMYGTTPEIATSLRAKNIALSNERKIDDLTSALLETTSLME